MRVEQPDAQTLPDQKERKKEFNTEMDIQALLKQLNELTGMQSVKTEINNMINLLKICKIRQENGLQTPPVTNHMVFLGNPGTGKTTVRLLYWSTNRYEYEDVRIDYKEELDAAFARLYYEKAYKNPSEAADHMALVHPEMHAYLHVFSDGQGAQMQVRENE